MKKSILFSLLLTIAVVGKAQLDSAAFTGSYILKIKSQEATLSSSNSATVDAQIIFYDTTYWDYTVKLEHEVYGYDRPLQGVLTKTSTDWWSSGSITAPTEGFYYAGDKEIMAYELNGGLALGLNSRLGVVFSTNSNMSYFVELNVMTMNYAPKKGKMVEYSVNGVDMLGSLPTSQKELEFVDEIAYGDIPPDSEPSKELKFNLPFSSVGVNVGVRIAL